jgi:uncharacterized repeat protein (TIGR01451 family)
MSPPRLLKVLREHVNQDWWRQVTAGLAIAGVVALVAWLGLRSGSGAETGLENRDPISRDSSAGPQSTSATPAPTGQIEQGNVAQVAINGGNFSDQLAGARPGDVVTFAVRLFNGGPDAVDNVLVAAERFDQARAVRTLSVQFTVASESTLVSPIEDTASVSTANTTGLCGILIADSPVRYRWGEAAMEPVGIEVFHHGYEVPTVGVGKPGAVFLSFRERLTRASRDGRC